jgi:uncharacterized membrane protein YgdD (TMEM256/DUF423 family)
MWITIASISGALAVAAGAFGAHGLRSRVGPEQVAAWLTASQYHLIHSAVLLAVALYAANSDKPIRIPGSLFLTGMLLFSGSIYALVLTPAKWLGPVTPLGGLCLIAGWISLLWLARS